MQQPDVLGRRIGAAIIDIGIAFLILLVVGGLFGNDVGPDAPDSARFGALDRLLFLALVVAYFIGTETAWGQTIGKKVLALRVVAADGSAPSTRAIVVRNLVRIVDALPAFYVVGAIAFFASGQKRQRLGDMAAKTRVIASDLPPDQPAAPPPPPPDEDVIAQIMR